MRESHIDAVIEDLVMLKDGQNDDLGKILSPAIEMLKKYRRERASLRKVMGQLGAIRAYSQNNLKLIGELRDGIFGKIKRRK